jgi:hypothetical protein
VTRMRRGVGPRLRLWWCGVDLRRVSAGGRIFVAQRAFGGDGLLQDTLRRGVGGITTLDHNRRMQQSRSHVWSSSACIG